MISLQFALRKMHADDISSVSELISMTYRDVGKNNKYSQFETEDLIAQRGSIDAIANQHRRYTFWVAQWENSIVGAMAISQNVLEKLYVHPKYGRKGIGTALFGQAERLITQSGYSEMTFGAFPDSVDFYRKMGARLIAHKVITGGPLRDRTIVLMCKKL